MLSGLTAFATQEKIGAGYFTAIGALERAKFGWFDLAHQAYRDIPINEQVELISLIGDVGLVNDKPQIHPRRCRPSGWSGARRAFARGDRVSDPGGLFHRAAGDPHQKAR